MVWRIRPYIIHRVSQYSRHNRQVLVFYIHITYLVPYSFYTSSSIYYILTSSSNFQRSTPTKAILFVLNFNKVIIRVYVSTKYRTQNLEIRVECRGTQTTVLLDKSGKRWNEFLLRRKEIDVSQMYLHEDSRREGTLHVHTQHQI